MEPNALLVWYNKLLWAGAHLKPNSQSAVTANDITLFTTTVSDPVVIGFLSSNGAISLVGLVSLYGEMVESGEALTLYDKDNIIEKYNSTVTEVTVILYKHYSVNDFNYTRRLATILDSLLSNIIACGYAGELLEVLYENDKD